MDNIFSDETLRKALSLNLIKLPDGIDNINQRYYNKAIVFTLVVLIFNFTVSGLISFNVIDKKLGVILMSIVTIAYIIDTIVSITKTLRNYFKILRKQVAQGTLMVDELYQRQFNNN